MRNCAPSRCRLAPRAEGSRLNHLSRTSLGAMQDPSMSQRAFPQLRMTNWKRTRAFYVEGLAFAVDWEHRFRAWLSCVCPGDSRRAVALSNRAHRRLPGRRRCLLVVDDIDALYREISGRGIKASEPPGDTEWHAREMTVVDSEGNKLRFSTAASE